MNHSNKDIKKRLNVLFHNNSEQVDAYLEQYGNKIDFKKIQAIREDFSAKVSSKSNISKKSNPLYDVDLICPICNTKLTHQELKANSLASDPTVFLVPIYHPIEPYSNINYLLQSVAVCPRCFYACQDHSDFNKISSLTGEMIPTKMNGTLIGILQDEINSRIDFSEASGVQNELKTFPRTIDAAILSYELADLCLARKEEQNVPYCSMKRGHIQLRIAHLKKMGKKSFRSHIQTAVQHLEKTFQISDYSKSEQEYRTCYLLCATHLFLKNEKFAREYISFLETSMNEAKDQNSNHNMTKIKPWLSKAKNLWEDRKRPEIWN